MSDVRCQLVFMPNHLTCERDVTKRDTPKTEPHQFTQLTHTCRQSSVVSLFLRQVTHHESTNAHDMPRAILRNYTRNTYTNL